MVEALTNLVAIFAALSLAGNILITLVGLKLPSHPKNVTQVCYAPFVTQTPLLL